MVPWWVTAVVGWCLLWKGDPVADAVVVGVGVGVGALVGVRGGAMVARGSQSFGGCLSWFMWLLLWLLCVDLTVNVTSNC